MKLLILSKRRLLVVVVLELIICLALVIISYFSPKYIADSTSIEPIKSVVIPPTNLNPPVSESTSGLPLRLKIPVINIDAPIESVGLTPSGAMDVPKNPDSVGWFELGPRPGNSGSAVIDGHSGIWLNGRETVFNNVKKLRVGDKLSVEDDRGTTISFVVRENRSFKPEADALSVFSSNDSKSHLNLITCENWNQASQTYTARLVIFTDKE
jgi:LPXTG-site transpeptidase (sortase) family protein